MGHTRWKDIRDNGKTPEQIAENKRWVQAESLRMSLRELREEAEKTQVEVSAESEMSQPQISALEKQDAPLLSSIRRYVRALGGEVEVVAVMGNKRITLHGI